ncbi:hypothetical protein IE81DRAFT_326275 [Ceraceosorus guamensis]|uniref:HPP transmembrane region domain-containing protein n=1 Tax=Ceraceosorus guamensis TaxID=1522189 RepID=A0A316VRK1_9BASI|nr:hypothetical protein IE81DRAFT_326275 [Ceraceosorus guamensis]PWN39678.1 hypothetical protein IE81DRAFT_326275 [Ceraceosorus guamensis]
MSEASASRPRAIDEQPKASIHRGSMSRIFMRSRATRVASRPSTSPAPPTRRHAVTQEEGSQLEDISADRQPHDDRTSGFCERSDKEESPEGYSSMLHFVETGRENRWQRRTVEGEGGERDADSRRRSSSRGSFLGRSREPIILNASRPGSNDEYVDESESRTWESTGHGWLAGGAPLDGIDEGRTGRRWRSTSRTLREGGSSISPDSRRGRGDSRSQSTGRYGGGRAGRSTSRAPALKKVEDDEGEGRGRLSPIENGTLKKAHFESTRSTEQSSSLSGDTHAAPEPSAAKKEEIAAPSRYPNLLKSFIGKREAGQTPVLPLVKHVPLTLEVWIWAWIGALVPIGAISALFSHANLFAADGPAPTPWASPVIVGSFGASAILLFGAPASPLAQPFQFVGGQMVSAFVGVAVTKLFELNSHYKISDTDQMGSLVWLAGGVAVATALLGMFITNTVHPPGGATALLAATSPPITKLGWRYLVVVLISSGIMLSWALFWMNLGRQAYPGQSWIPPPGPARAHSVWGIFDAARAKAREVKEHKRQEADKELAVQ